MRAAPRPEAVAVRAEVGSISAAAPAAGLAGSADPPPSESPARASRHRASGSGRGAPAQAGSCHRARIARIRGHAVFRYSAVWRIVRPSTPGTALVGLDAFPRRLHVLSRERLPKQVISPPFLVVRMPRRPCFIAHRRARLHRALPPSPRFPRLLMHCTSERHGRRPSFSFGPSPPGSSQLLRPLLTSRSGSAPSPFQAQGEISPGKNATPSPHNRRIYAA
jgi:hypothetical protein